MIIMKKKNCFLLILLFFCILLIYQINVEAYNIKYSNDIENFECKIYGIVKESITCVPNPLQGATVTALSFNSLGTKLISSNITDENGEYELNVEPGKYIVFAYKSAYRQIYPRIFYSVNPLSGQEINCSFILRERFFLNSFIFKFVSNLDQNFILN